MNRLNLRSLLLTQQLKAGKLYDFDYDNQIIKNSNYDAKTTYKKCKGYLPGIATMGDKIVYIENCDCNANVKFEQDQTLKRAYPIIGIRERKDKSFSHGCWLILQKNNRNCA
tara:strand:+ start:256 stop:591 length:336 start_codon:yes stop_codon:yes gene_type:complete